MAQIICQMCKKEIPILRTVNHQMEVCEECYQPVITLPDSPDKKHTEDCGIDGLVLHHQCPDACMQIMTPEEVGA